MSFQKRVTSCCDTQGTAGCAINISWKTVPLLPTSPAGSAIFCRGTFLEKATFHLRWNRGSLQTWEGGRWLGYGEGFFTRSPQARLRRQYSESKSQIKTHRGLALPTILRQGRKCSLTKSLCLAGMPARAAPVRPGAEWYHVLSLAGRVQRRAGSGSFDP